MSPKAMKKVGRLNFPMALLYKYERKKEKKEKKFQQI